MIKIYLVRSLAKVKSASVIKQLNLITMLVTILQIYTNSLQYTQISIETIFDQIPNIHILAKFGSIFDLSNIGKLFDQIPIFLLLRFDHIPTSIFDLIPTSFLSNSAFPFIVRDLK